MIAEEALMHANVLAASDPDPERAFRYRPFAYGSARAAARHAEAGPPAPPRRRFAALRAAVLAALPGFAPAARPAAGTQLPACC